MVAPIMLGLEGPVLSAAERALIERIQPASFILFARNIQTPPQVRALTDELASLSPFPTPLISVDQEGGRVQRLAFEGKLPPMGLMGRWYDANPIAATEGTRLINALLAAQLRSVGATWMLAPVLDVSHPETHGVIGDRAFHANPKVVASLGKAALEGIAEGGCLPCIKHAPGHGRAKADSHSELPLVQASKAELESDWQPFAALAPYTPFMMTAHVHYPALGDGPATCSAAIVQNMRTDFAFQGLVVADDIGMNALEGGYLQRLNAAHGAGCEMVICSLSKLQHGMAGTVFDADNFEALQQASHLPSLSMRAHKVFSELTLPPAPTEPQVAHMRTRLMALWDDGPARMGYALPL